jgi:hypothetical protein
MPTIAKHVRLHAFPQAGPDQGGTLLLLREESEDSHDCSACGALLLEGCRLDRLPGVRGV